MMGHKERAFGPLPPVTLEELVPADHFYWHLERSLDLSFVRALVRDAYAESGRPSIDPVVSFKLQLVMFFGGIRSRRSTGCGAARLSHGEGRRMAQMLAVSPMISINGTGKHTGLAAVHC